MPKYRSVGHNEKGAEHKANPHQGAGVGRLEALHLPGDGQQRNGIADAAPKIPDKHRNCEDASKRPGEANKEDAAPR